MTSGAADCSAAEAVSRNFREPPVHDSKLVPGVAVLSVLDARVYALEADSDRVDQNSDIGLQSLHDVLNSNWPKKPVDAF